METLGALVLAGALFLAYANGANDNFKGVATLYGSGLVGYRSALIWGTAATFAGALAAAVLAQELVAVFTGKGLVPDALVGEPAFMLAVVVGAAATVFASALLGLPVSTTHALTGALLGAGLAAVGGGIALPTLARSFVVPLAVSPLIPVALLGVMYPATARAVRLLPPGAGENGLAGRLAAALAGDVEACHAERRESLPAGRSQGVSPIGAMNAAHLVSAGAVSFARGLNDTPKIVAVALAAAAADIRVSTVLIAAAMAAGGLLHARRIACTLACRITPMSHGQGALANVITSGVVIGASVLGMPVSTTHVSCGALFGLGAVTGGLNRRVSGGILFAWVVTLPAAGLFAALAHRATAAAG